MATGLRKLELRMGGVADKTEQANDALAKTGAIVQGLGRVSAPAVGGSVNEGGGAFSKLAADVDEAVTAAKAGAEQIKAVSEETSVIVADTLTRVRSFNAAAAGSFAATRQTATETKIEVEGLTYELFRTLNATEFDVEDFATQQREKIQTLRELGLGENLDAYAVGFERLRRGDLSPQLTREFQVMLTQIRQTITTLGGTAGRTFNFAELEREINEMARNARDAARNTRLGRTSGVLGKERGKNGCDEGPSLSILRGSGALR